MKSYSRIFVSVVLLVGLVCGIIPSSVFAQSDNYYPASPDSVVQTGTSGSIEYKGLLIDESASYSPVGAGYYLPGGTAPASASKVVSVGSNKYLLNALSYGDSSNKSVGKVTLRVYDLADPYNPSLKQTVDISGAFVTKFPAFANGFAPGCRVDLMDAVSYQGKVVGFLNMTCGYGYANETAYGKIMFSYAPGGSLDVVNAFEKHGRFRDEGYKPAISALFVGTDGVLYGVGVGSEKLASDVNQSYVSVWSLSNLAASSYQAVSDSGSIIKSAYNNVQYGVNYAFVLGQGYVIKQSPYGFRNPIVEGVVYQGSTPYVVFHVSELSEKEHSGGYTPWTMVVSLASPTSPSVAFMMADDVLFTNQSCGSGIVDEGCDRTFFERVVGRFDESGYKTTSPTKVIDAQLPIVYFNYRIDDGSRDSTILRYLATHTFNPPLSGGIRWRHQLGAIDLSSPSSPSRIGAPIVSSVFGLADDAFGRLSWTDSSFQFAGPEIINPKSGLTRGSGMPLAASNGVVLFDLAVEYDRSCVEANGMTPSCVIINDPTARDQLAIGAFAADGSLAWIPDTNGALSALKTKAKNLSKFTLLSLTSGAVTQVTSNTFAAYATRGTFLEVFKVSATPFAQGGGGGGITPGTTLPPTPISPPNPFSFKNLLRIFTRLFQFN